MRFLLPLLMMTCMTSAQSIQDCQRRFRQYVDFHGSLANSVKFNTTSITINTPDLKSTFYSAELPLLNRYFSQADPASCVAILRRKGHRQWRKGEMDTIAASLQQPRSVLRPQGELAGLRIAIDPGHFATTMAEAAAEQKFLCFQTGADSIMLFESELTYSTAFLLKSWLEEKGAIVMITRDKANHTSFGCSWTEWQYLHKTRVLDSLVKTGYLPKARADQLKHTGSYQLFWDFFRDYELANRAELINNFEPDLTCIIHYNVDEKNAPWKCQTGKNFTMAFIGGALTASDIRKPENVVHLVRYLVTEDLDDSRKLSAATVKEFHDRLKIPVATASDASYLAENCLWSGASGVFCRNLVLCRKVRSPLVYGECLYQDNQVESVELMKKTRNLYGIQVSERVELTALSYFNAVLNFCNSH